MSDIQPNEEKKGKQVVLCEVCKQRPYKYTCPGCNKRTCSLECVRRHKEMDHCTGVRNHTKFVALSDFNDGILHDDYRFLSDVACKVDSSLKDIEYFPSWKDFHMVEKAKQTQRGSVPQFISTLIEQAHQRHTNIITLPRGMSKQKENQSRYIYSKGLIMWTTKWIFSSVTPPLSLTTKVSELDIVGDVILKELNNISNHLYPIIAKYKKIGLNNIIILLEKYVCYDETQTSRHLINTSHFIDLSSSQKEYYIVPSNRSFRDILAGVDILEYPVFYLIFASELSNYHCCNLPLIPLPEWTPPERKPKRSADDNIENESKKQKLEEETGM